MDNGFLDFGLIIQPADISRYDALTLPNKDTWGVIMDKKSPLASKRAIRREDLISYPLIISKQISRRPSAKEGLAKWLGLDTCWMGIYPWEKTINEFSDYFKLPDNIKPYSLIAVGYGAEKKERPERFDVSKIHVNKW